MSIQASWRTSKAQQQAFKALHRTNASTHYNVLLDERINFQEHDNFQNDTFGNFLWHRVLKALNQLLSPEF
jgi:hypothetical protein